MSDLSSTKLEMIQSKIPHWYRKYSEDKSALYAVLNAFAEQLEQSEGYADRVNNCIGIDNTADEDLEFRWGSILSTLRKQNEPYYLYRNRLKLVLPSMSGGTKDSIIYAMAVCIGVEKDKQLQTDYIEVYDTWDYTGNGNDELDKNPGNFVCIIDLNVGSDALDIEDDVITVIKKVKASGTNFYVLYKNFKIVRYYEFDRFRYETLNLVSYSDFGE